jgi:hypothetical protein
VNQWPCVGCTGDPQAQGIPGRLTPNLSSRRERSALLRPKPPPLQKKNAPHHSVVSRRLRRSPSNLTTNAAHAAGAAMLDFTHTTTITAERYEGSHEEIESLRYPRFLALRGLNAEPPPPPSTLTPSQRAARQQFDLSEAHALAKRKPLSGAHKRLLESFARDELRAGRISEAYLSALDRVIRRGAASERQPISTWDEYLGTRQTLRTITTQLVAAGYMREVTAPQGQGFIGTVRLWTPPQRCTASPLPGDDGEVLSTAPRNLTAADVPY